MSCQSRHVSAYIDTRGRSATAVERSVKPIETSPEARAVTVRSRSAYVCGMGGDRVKLRDVRQGGDGGQDRSRLTDYFQTFVSSVPSGRLIILLSSTTSTTSR